MKITHALIAASIALVPATSMAVDKEALKKAKEAAKEAAKEKAKEMAHDKAAAQADKTEAKVEAKKAEEKAAEAKGDEESAMHSKNLGAIERLEQIATATANAELTAVVARLKEKETKRHELAAPAAPAAPAKK